MQISFFEEFPTKKSLGQLELVTWPTKLYLAAPSLSGFIRVKNQIKNKKVKEFIYWPTLKKEEGYWISPFSQRKALRRIFNGLKNKKIPLMLDLELPTTQNPCLYFTQLLNFPRNKRLIRDFLENYPGEIYLAEYFPEGKLKEKFLQLAGLHYTNKRVKIIKMIYHSLHDFHKEFVKEELKEGKEEFKDNFLAAFGVIYPGRGNEPVISAEVLEKDLQMAKKAGIKEVIIFRLGGLDKKYSLMFKKFLRS